MNILQFDINGQSGLIKVKIWQWSVIVQDEAIHTVCWKKEKSISTNSEKDIHVRAVTLKKEHNQITST